MRVHRKSSRYLNAVEGRSLNRCTLPGVGHILGRPPTSDEYARAVAYCRDHGLDDAASVFAAILRRLSWTPRGER